MSLSNPKNIFEWLEHLTYKKSSYNSFEEKSWENFNAYMVHRFVSMYEGYIDIANIAQRFHPTDKRGIYNFYCEMLPKKKMFLRYIKSKIKTSPKEVKQYISNYYKCSLDEANEYITLLDKSDIKIIFDKLGVEIKEQKQLLKKL
mgnify:FL=1|tara:strand:+ start:757 stop:1191 length:435 start_codon:yes stop_codon:yes gene_type:complete